MKIKALNENKSIILRALRLHIVIRAINLGVFSLFLKLVLLEVKLVLEQK